MIRYWFEFKESDEVALLGLHRGCGVTAVNFDDAINILKQRIFKHKEVPALEKYVENIDIEKLDQGHIIPNMWTPNYRGIWYPMSFHDNY
jgi:hypothetical protein